MLSKLNASQTKYGTVRIIDLIKNDQLKDVLQQGNQNKEVDPAQLKTVLGIKEFTDPLPDFWNHIKHYPQSIGFFCAIAIIFSHHKYIEIFKNANPQYMKGTIHRNKFDTEKPFTNIRGVLVKSGATDRIYERSDDVPYDFSLIFRNGELGLLVKELFLNRLGSIGWNPPSSEFNRDFYEQCIYYEFHKVLGLTNEEFRSWLDGNTLEMPSLDSSSVDLTKTISVDTHLLVSLRAKQFMIITGPSGTGKTYEVRKLANSLNPYIKTNKHFNISFIPVEAGWKDGRHLIGYKTPFSEVGEVYQTTPLVNLLLRANSDKFNEIPFFVIFDEMNLSHVEMYFARFLSLIETTRHPNLDEEPILNVDELILMKKAHYHNYEIIALINEAIDSGGLFISNNIFFIGTVNIDETTYMFSPKVLDRAFVIEKTTEKPSEALKSTNKYFSELTVNGINKFLIDTRSVRPENEELIQFLDNVYELVQDNFPFGYRVVKECLDFFEAANELKEKYGVDLEWLNDNNLIYDEILMQKILPKIHGNRKQLTNTLKNLIQLCGEESNPTLPKAFNKLNAMLKNLQIIGYGGFIV